MYRTRIVLRRLLSDVDGLHCSFFDMARQKCEDDEHQRHDQIRHAVEVEGQVLPGSKTPETVIKQY